MTAKQRIFVAGLIFAVDLLVCSVWTYWVASSMLESLSGTGSGGIAGVSVGGGAMESLITVLPPIFTIVLARASKPLPLAGYWRNAHLTALLALIVFPMMGGLRVIMVSIVVLLPVQLFFVIGALAIWIGRPVTRPGTPPEASS